MGSVSTIGLVCSTTDECLKRTPFSMCEASVCRCEAGYALSTSYNQCTQTIRFGHVCERHQTCRIWDSNMNCDPVRKRCLCAYTHVFDEATQVCQYKIPSICPTGYKWNVRIGDCEGRGRHRGSDKMIDVVIVFVFFVILLLVIRKWKPSYQGLDRDLSWPMRREPAATVLFISAGRPSVWSSSSDLEPQGHQVSSALPPAPPQYNTLSESNIFEPPEPPPSYEEAMSMVGRGGAAPAKTATQPCPTATASSSCSSGPPPPPQSRPPRPPLGRRDSDDPFEV